MSNFVPNNNDNLVACWLTDSGHLQETKLIGYRITETGRATLVADLGCDQHRPFVVLDRATDTWRSASGRHSGKRSDLARHLMEANSQQVAANHLQRVIDDHRSFDRAQTAIVALLDEIDAMATSLTPTGLAAAAKLTAAIAICDPLAWREMHKEFKSSLNTIRTMTTGEQHHGRSIAKADESIQQND